MGDRNNPIKFGPEWLRNLAAERSAGTSAGSQSNAAASAAGSGAAAMASGGNPPASASNTNTAAHAQPKVQLAKLRYGREEMLALYDRTSEAPQELKFIDILYQPRGKPPVALNNTFEDEMRETMRAGPPIGGMSPGERFGLGRGMGRGLNITEARGRARIPFVRQTSAGRGAPWHTGVPRMPAFGGGPEEEAPATLRSWSNTNNGAPRSAGDQPEWNPNKMFRNKRQGNTTNWRQTGREDDEWRQEVGRSRGTQQDKWERDWGDRPTTEKSPSWNSNRRTWVGGDSQNEENLPEWAIDTAEGCGGSFDSSGAFHGYSNDDTNLPKNQESAFPLTRSHTHGSFVRSKNAEEGSEEWWASEKAKKLSPKRFDASDLKFKKISAVIPDIPGASAIPASKSGSKDGSEKDKPGTPTGPTEESPHDNGEEAYCKKNVRFSESKRFDSLMRSDINMEEAKDDRSNFQSVMITPNNSLRQKHQNIVTATGTNNRQNRKPGILQMLPNNPPASDSELGKQQTAEEKIAAEMMDLTLEDNEYPTMPPGENPLANASPISSVSMMSKPPPMQLRITSPVNHNPMAMNTAPGMQGMQSMQTVGISNSALNASLGLSLGPSNPMAQMGMPMQNIPPPVMPNPGMQNANVGGSAMQGGMPGFPTGMPGMSGPNVVNNSLFMGQNSNSMQSNDIPMPNHNNPNNMYPMHGLQHPGAQSGFGSSIYTNIMQQASNAPAPCAQALSEQWYYEDPKKSVQGPFSSKEMYNWYRAGFFSPTLMVRRACDALMRPLGSYGPVVPFVQLDMLAGYPMPGGFEPRQVSRESLLSSQQSLGMDVMNMALNETNSMDSMQYSNVNRMRNPPYGQSQQMVESLWSQPSTSQDMLWMQQAINNRNENRVNNLPMFFWEQQPSAIASNSLLPEEIAKEMKTEDQILAQLRASQNLSSPQNLPYLSEQPPPPALKPEEGYHKAGAPTMDELQKLLQQETPTLPPLDSREQQQQEVKKEAPPAHAEASTPDVIAKSPPHSKPAPEPKQPAKPAKADDKSAKKDSAAKTKAKKSKEERKEESQEAKPKEEEPAAEKRSQESSPTKNKKEEKINKKELEKEKKEWVKEGFTIVKGAEKSASKESKKKTEEAKAAEEAERRRKEEEKLAAEGEKKKKQAEALKKQQEPPPSRPAELVMKKAAWSGVAARAHLSPSREGLTLAEIQRLERETKLQQMKEQQQMMQMIAQQQAAALAREQEMQAGLGWAKKKGNAMNCGGQSLAEIQAEARKQAAAAAAAQAQAQALEEAQAAPLAIHPTPWSNPPPAGGFWETMALSASSSRPLDSPKTVEKKKKPIPAPAPAPASVPAPSSASGSAPAPAPKKEITPAAQFETWCTTVLASWSAKIDVPTFVGFLKDIESPYEVKDYVKCYLGESKETGDFARQFLEKRSKLLRVGMVTPSDDLCSPAMAVNPRTLSNSDYQEVKGKGKKTKKNKMLKIDARILGFSVTASEDRINVGDIDTV